MAKYLLVSVCEREIGSAQFDSFEDARAQMMYELGEEFTNSEHDPDDEGATWERIATHTEFREYESEDYGFAFGETWAWSNMDRKYSLDWKIIEVA